MPGRQYSSNTYRYGFNGKENDKEAVGTGQGTQDYGFRIYNPSLGRFLSVDPLTKDYPWNSTYAFAENDVIRCIDLEGREKDVVVVIYDPTNPNRKRTNFAVKMTFSQLFPGQKNGPYGKTGYVLFVYDIQSKKVVSQTYHNEDVKAIEDNIYFQNSKLLHVNEKGSGGVPEVDGYDPLTGNTNPTVGPHGGPSSYDNKYDYDPDYIEKNKNKGERYDKYYNEEGPVVGVAINKDGDTIDVYRYNEPQKPNGLKGQHNTVKGEKNWNEGVNETKKLKKQN